MKAYILKVWNALCHSKDGLISTFRNEISFRLELLMAVVLIPLASLLPLEVIEKVLLITSVLIVLIAELLNTAVECALDRISMEHHWLSKRAKDAGSAAVLLSFLLLGITWLVLCHEVLFEIPSW